MSHGFKVHVPPISRIQRGDKSDEKICDTIRLTGSFGCDLPVLVLLPLPSYSRPDAAGQISSFHFLFPLTLSPLFPWADPICPVVLLYSPFATEFPKLIQIALKYLRIALFC